MTVFVIYDGGIVVDASEGRPSKAALALFFSPTAKAEAAPDGVGLGWLRAADGTYSAPPQPEAPAEPKPAAEATA